ncbi:MAG: FAD binding domain-containing protein [Acidimicrobiales bacterium]
MVKIATCDGAPGLEDPLLPQPEGSVRLDEHTLCIGAAVTLQELVDDERVPAVIRHAARRDQPRAVRTLATVGDCVSAADSDSELLSTLLAYDATVTVYDRHRSMTMPLARALSGHASLIRCLVTALVIETDGVAFAARVGRAPDERPVVAAVARRKVNGELRVALSGVATFPVVAAKTDVVDPPGDVTASNEYRRVLATTVMIRALEGV